MMHLAEVLNIKPTPYSTTVIENKLERIMSLLNHWLNEHSEGNQCQNLFDIFSEASHELPPNILSV